MSGFPDPVVTRRGDDPTAPLVVLLHACGVAERLAAWLSPASVEVPLR